MGELSDRKLLEWAAKSGIVPEDVPKVASNDKPNMTFGMPLLEDMSLRRILSIVAPTLRRNYIVPELRSNLLAAERAKLIHQFSSAQFKKSAIVIMGEPTQEYKDIVNKRTMVDKRAKLEMERKKKALEMERKRMLDERRRKTEEAR